MRGKLGKFNKVNNDWDWVKLIYGQWVNRALNLKLTMRRLPILLVVDMAALDPNWSMVYGKLME